MASGKVKITGLRELSTALARLPKSTSKAVCRRVLKEGGEPIASAAIAKAPVRIGNLRESIEVSTKLAKSQKTGGAKKTGSGWRSEAKTVVEMYVGPGQHPQAITQEFGTFKEPAQPYMRPAWDSQKMNTLYIITHRLGVEIFTTAQRLAAKSAKRG